MNREQLFDAVDDRSVIFFSDGFCYTGERSIYQFSAKVHVDLSRHDKLSVSIYERKIDNAIFEYIANNIQSNIRELEGAFNKIIAASDGFDHFVCKLF